MANSEAKAKNKKFFSEWLRYQFKEMRKNGSLYLFMLPYLLVFTTFTILPVVVAMYFSFTYFNVLEPPQWTGFDNYIRLFTADDLFMTAFKNTIFFAYQIHFSHFLTCHNTICRYIFTGYIFFQCT